MIKIKIAVPSNDKVTISSHFGRTKGFVIYEIENDKIIEKSYKQNDFTGHTKSSHDNNDEHGNHSHSHSGIFNSLGDCTVVIASGMGQRLYNDFKEKNIKVFVTKEMNIDTALNLYINNELDNNSDECCSH